MQTYGSLGGGSVQLLSTETATQLTGGTTQLALDLSPGWNGQPCTFNFYSGGPNGTLVYSETQSSPTTDANVYYWYNVAFGVTGYADVTPPGNLDTSIQSSGWDWWSGPGTQLDVFIKTPGGTVLPDTDHIDFMDFLVPKTGATQYTSETWTAGGGIGSFEITGEQVVPEPSTVTLLGPVLSPCWATLGDGGAGQRHDDRYRKAVQSASRKRRRTMLKRSSANSIGRRAWPMRVSKACG